MKKKPTALLICNKVLELMKEKDIGQIKVTEIVSALSISRNTFYNYYDSVFDVLQEIEDEHIAEIRRISAEYKNCPLDDRYFNEPCPSMLAILEFMNSKKTISRILWGPHGDQTFQLRTRRLIRENFYERAVKEKYISTSNEYIAASIVGSHQAIVTYWLLNDTNISLEELAVLLYRMMFCFKQLAAFNN